MRRQGRAYIAAMIAAALFGCGARAPEREFSAAPTTQVDRINAFMDEESGLTIRNVYQARSEAHQSVYFVAAELVGPGANGQVGVWAHTGPPMRPASR